MGYYYNEPNSSFYGLDVTDLTVEQLHKVDSRKLIRCCNVDPRVESIVAHRINNCFNYDTLSFLDFLNEAWWNQFTEIKEAYNKLYVKTNRFSDDNTGNYLRSILFWNGLNDENKMREIKEKSIGNGSAFEIREVRIDWLCEHDADLAKKIIDNTFEDSYYINMNDVAHVIQTSGPEIIKELSQLVMSRSNKDLQLALLSSPHTPTEYMERILRMLAKRRNYRCPNIYRPFYNKEIKNLPPVTRLEALENLLYMMNRAKPPYNKPSHMLPDCKDDDEFKSLLFSLTTKYTSRVELLYDKYKLLKENEGKTNE